MTTITGRTIVEKSSFLDVDRDLRPRPKRVEEVLRPELRVDFRNLELRAAWELLKIV